MSKSDSSAHIVFKPTFEAVENIQQQLRRHIENLAKENRCLKGEEEKTLFYKELSHATLGLGTFKSFTIEIDRMYRYGNVESIARWLADQTQNKISIPGEEGKKKSPEIDISIGWKKLLELLFFVFPVALDKAISMSRETEAFPNRKDSFYVGD